MKDKWPLKNSNCRKYNLAKRTTLFFSLSTFLLLMYIANPIPCAKVTYFFVFQVLCTFSIYRGYVFCVVYSLSFCYINVILKVALFVCVSTVFMCVTFCKIFLGLYLKKCKQGTIEYCKSIIFVCSSFNCK